MSDTPQNALSLLVKPANADCNIACRYCFYTPKKRLFPGKTRMSIKILERMIAQFLDVASSEAWLSWQGGEPTLMGLDFYLRAIEFEKRYKKKEQRVYNAFQTNSLLLDEKWAKFFRDNNFLVGVSIDGPAKFHDIYRLTKGGEPTHSLVMEKIKLLQQYNVQFNALTVLTDKNGKEPETLFEFFQDKGINYMQFIPCLEANQGRDGLASFSINPDIYGDFLCRMFDKWYDNGAPFCYIREYEEWFIGYVYGTHPSCAFTPYCGGSLVVEYNGNVYPCDFFVQPQWLLGNINQTPLSHLLSGDLYQEFRLRKQNLDKQCLNCKWLKSCWGGCYKFRLNEKGRFIKRNYYCPAYRRFFGYSYDKFARLKANLIKSRGKTGGACKSS